MENLPRYRWSWISTFSVLLSTIEFTQCPKNKYLLTLFANEYLLKLLVIDVKNIVFNIVVSSQLIQRKF